MPDPSGPKKCSKTSCKIILEPNDAFKTCLMHRQQQNARDNLKKTAREQGKASNSSTPGPSHATPPLSEPPRPPTKHQPSGNMAKPKRKLSISSSNESMEQDIPSKRPKVSFPSFPGRQELCADKRFKLGPAPKPFANQNELFKEIQDLFHADKEDISFCGEYSMPDEAPQAVNEEDLLARKQSDRRIIHSHSERVCRMTGCRWK